MKYHLSRDLIVSYTNMVMFQRKNLTCDSANWNILVIQMIDETKARLHEEILRSAGVTRDDEDFSMWFAMTIEKEIEDRILAEEEGRLYLTERRSA